tara:strand:- start:874 stop:1170 length:297 start_codon:yes stop_codon:yes gene_type:complete
MNEDLRTEKEILHQLEDRIDEINLYLWGRGEGKNIMSPYGETTLRGRIGNNVERLLDEKLNKIEEKLDKDMMTIGEFTIVLAIILVGVLACLAWVLFT